MISNKRFMFISILDANHVRFRLLLMKRLQEMGNEIFAVCPRGSLTHIFAENNIFHVDWKCRRDNRNPFYEIITIINLRSIIKKCNPDIVHAFTIRPNIYVGLISNYKKFNYKIINTVSGMGTIYTSHGTYVQSIVNILYKLSFKKSQRVIYLNEDDEKYFINNHIISENKAIIIYGEGIDINKFVPPKRNEFQSNNKNISILLVSRFIREKGIIEYLKSAEIIKKKYGDQVIFSILGHFDPGNPSSLSQKELQPYIDKKIINNYGYQEPLLYYQSSDIYCLPSYREGIPVSVLEAMACGLPVVTTDAVGCKETVDEGINGFKVPIKNVELLVDRLERLINDPELRQRMGRAGREKAIQEFSVDKVVDQHIELYEKILNEKMG